MRNRHAASATFHRVVLASVLAIMAGQARGTLVPEGSDAEKLEIRTIIDGYKKDSAKAAAIVAELEKPSTGDVKVRFGKTIDIATANVATKVITLNKAAIAELKLIEKPGGGGKALEQSSASYWFGHEGIHIIEPTLTEDQVVARNNEVRVEKKSAKRSKYEYSIVDGKAVVPFDDGSKLDVTDALKKSASAGGSPGVAISQQASGLLLRAIEKAQGEFSLGLDPAAGAQYMTVGLPVEFGGASVSLRLTDLFADISASTSGDFSLVAKDFRMTFDGFYLGSQYTGTNTIRPYLDHQTPYGYIEWLSASAFKFDLSGDLGWTNDLFAADDQRLAIESIEGQMSMDQTASNLWTGSGDLVGVKFTAVPEPASLTLALAALLALGAAARRRSMCRLAR